MNLQLTAKFVMVLALLSLAVSITATPTIEFVGSYDTGPDSAFGVCVSGDFAYLGLGDGGIKIINISDPTDPTLVTSYLTPSYVRDLDVSGNYAYVTDRYTGVLVMDISDPMSPDSVSTLVTGAPSGDVQIVGNFAYVASSDAGLEIFDVSDPYNPVFADNLPASGFADGVFVTEGYAYVAKYNGGLQIVDVSDPYAATLAGWYDSLSGHDVHVAGNYAYVGARGDGLQIIDVSDAFNPCWVSSYSTPGTARGVFVTGNHAFVTDSDVGLHVVDVSDPANPVLVGLYETPGQAFDVHVSGGYIFVADRAGGLQILQFASLIIPSLSVLPCDDECVMQPIAIDIQDSIQAIALPVRIPAGVELVSWSWDGLINEAWHATFEEATDSTFFIHFQDTLGIGLPPGQHTVLNLCFHAQPECMTSTFIQWDTTFSDDQFKTLAFTNMQYETIYPAFDIDRDSTQILGYLPGDVDNSGGVDISDLVYVVDYMFTGGPPPCVMDALDVNGSCTVDISDLVYIVDYMFQGGLELQCGCVSSGMTAKMTSHTEIVMTTNIDNGMTTISLTAPFDLRALDLTLAGPDDATPVSLVGDALDMVYGQDGDRVKIGILDLDGANVISAGENHVIQLQGEYEIVSAIVATDGRTTYAATIGDAAKGSTLPTEFSLDQNYPNPFNPVTTISFSLPVASDASLTIYNVMGQKVATVADGFYDAGVHAVEWDGSSVASGVYFYRLETNAYTETKKMMLLK